MCPEAAAGLVAVVSARNLPLPPPSLSAVVGFAPRGPQRRRARRRWRRWFFCRCRLRERGARSFPCPVLAPAPAPPGCSQPLIPRRGRRDHVRLGGGGESRPPAQAGGAGGRHHWQGQCRPRRQLLSLAAVPRAPSPPSPSRCPLLLLRKEQPAAASSLSRSRCRDSRLAAPLGLRALYGGRGLPAGIRAVPGGQTL